MDEGFSDEERRALAAADPAAGALASAELRERIAGIPARDERVSARGRRRWLVPVAASIAVVAAAVGGGYVWSSGGFGNNPAMAPLAVETGSPADPAPPIGGTGAGTTTQASGSTRNEVTDSMVAWWPGRQRFIVPELEKTPPRAEADVYAVDAASRFTAEETARMAAALGVTGEVRSDESGGWRIDGSGAIFGLGAWGQVYFSDNSRDPLASCETSAHAAHGDDAEAFTREMQACVADLQMPSDEAAREWLRTFLAAIGMDVDSTRITVTPNKESGTVTARAERVVEGNVTRITADVTVSTQGIAYASGPIGDVVSLDGYPLISPSEAAERLSDPGFTPELVGFPEPPMEPYVNAPPPAPPAVPSAGSRIPWPIEEHEIVAVRLGLTLISAEGVTYLVPAYEFTASDDTVWSVPAVAESALDTAPAKR